MAISWDALTDLVLPRHCVGCDRPGTPWCADCLPSAAVCVPVAGLTVCAADGYDGVVRRALLGYKEHGRRDLAAPLGGCLAAAVRLLLARTGRPPVGVVLVGAPSRRAAVAARGGDHVRRLARRAAPQCGVRPAPGALRLVRGVQDSAGLGVAERAANLAGAVRARPPSGHRTAILVDDIVTTGATLRECDRALRDAGWTVLGAAVVAATARRFTDNPLAGPRSAV